MLEPASAALQYGEQINHFLTQIKKELEAQNLLMAAPVSNPELLDQYLLELNTFYYQSFQERFVPQYLAAIEANIRHLNHLSRQDTSLKKNIITSFKHYAGLFNKTKHISARLRGLARELEPQWSAIKQSNDKRCADLSYLLKDYYQGWSDFLNHLRNIQLLLNDQQLMMALHHYPAHSSVTSLFDRWQADDAKAVRNLKRSLAAWQLALRILVRFQDNSLPNKTAWGQMIAELEKNDAAWDNRKVAPNVRSWYKYHVQEKYLLYVQILKLNSEKNDGKGMTQIAGQFEKWLSSWLYILEQALSFKTRGDEYWADCLLDINLMDEKYCSQILTYSGQAMQSINDLLESLTSSIHSSYLNHSQRAAQLLADSRQYIKEQLNYPSSRLRILAPALDKLMNQIDLLDNRLELLDERDHYAREAEKQYAAIMEQLNLSLEFLTMLKHQLEPNLNLKTIELEFPEVNLRLDHIPIARGAMLPPQLSYLVDEGLIFTQVADEPAGRVLYEEGDIFIIHLDEFQTMEIPKIIIARKG